MSEASKISMRQWKSDTDGIERLRQEFVSIPKPEPDEVLVKICAVSLNFRDIEVVIGDYDHHDSISSPSSIVPCSDMVGTVVKLGTRSNSDAKSSEWFEGDRVMAIFNLTHLTGQITNKHLPSGLGLPLPGVLSEYRCFPVDALVKAPSYLSDAEGSTLPIAASTAWMALNWMQPIGQPMRGSEKVVLLQGTGGVSMAGLQLAYACGMTTIVTSSSDDKLRKAKELGADHLVNYRTNPEWQDAIMQITGGEGADIIFEQGGPATLAKSFACVKWGGLISCIGYLSGKQDELGDRTNTNVLALRRNVTLKGIWNGPKDRLDEVVGLYEQAGIRPVVDRVFAFDEAKEAFAYVAEGSHFGKVVIQVA